MLLRIYRVILKTSEGCGRGWDDHSILVILHPSIRLNSQPYPMEGNDSS